MDTLQSLSDHELAKKLDEKDSAVLAVIYERYWALLYDHARKMLHDDVLAEDVVQNVFLHLIHNMGHLQITSSLSGYLYRSTKNEVLNQISKSNNRQKYVDSLKDFYNRGSYETDERILAKELKERIEKVVLGFPEKMRQVFELSRNENLSRKEIAAVTNTSEHTVNAQLGRALKILKSKLYSLFF